MKRIRTASKYFYLTGGELRAFKHQVTDIPLVKKNTSHLYLWTHRGASCHCKMLGTDKAWEQFDCLENSYFERQNKREDEIAAASPSGIPLGELSSCLKVMVRVANSQKLAPHRIAENVRKVSAQFGVQLTDDYVNVPSYEQMHLSDFQ